MILVPSVLMPGADLIDLCHLSVPQDLFLAVLEQSTTVVRSTALLGEARALHAGAAWGTRPAMRQRQQFLGGVFVIQWWCNCRAKILIPLRLFPRVLFYHLSPWSTLGRYKRTTLNEQVLDRGHRLCCNCADSLAAIFIWTCWDGVSAVEHGSPIGISLLSAGAEILTPLLYNGRWNIRCGYEWLCLGAEQLQHAHARRLRVQTMRGKFAL